MAESRTSSSCGDEILKTKGTKGTMKLSVICLAGLAALVSGKSPTGNYAPGDVSCPAGNSSFLRDGNSLSKEEIAWVKSRQEKTDAALHDFLSELDLEDFDVDGFFNNATQSIKLGLGFSGGGYRAMLVGAGEIAALDNRTSSVSEGGLGGLLQGATHISALSGGSWLLGSLVMSGFPDIERVVLEDPDDIWNLTESRQLINQKALWTIVFPALFDNIEGLESHLNYWDNDDNGIKYDLKRKEKAGFDTTVTDPWTRGLAHQLFANGTDNFGSSATWSDVQDMSIFKEHDIPFPIILAIGRKPNTLVYNLNSTIVEFNPFEMGSFDTSLNSFTNLKYIGTNVTNGVPVDDQCIAGFDNAGFVMGTSSSLFNMFLNTLVCDDCDSLNVIVKPVVKKLLKKLSNEYEDIARYSPNPFYHSQYSKSENITKNDTLYLVDGGEAGEVIPMAPLLNTNRALDVVLAFDNSNDDVYNWPVGNSLILSYERQFSEQGKYEVCPYVPDKSTFISQNLTARPSFFGCDAKNLTDLVKDDVIPPLVVYFANRPYQFSSNTTLFKLTYTDEEKKGMIQNGYDIATRLNSTIDTEFNACVGCAIIRREQERQGVEQSEQCKKCFERYCWDGKIDHTLDASYPPVNFTDDARTNGSAALYT